MTSDQQLREIDKGIDTCGELLSFLVPEKVGLLEAFLKFQAQRFYQEAILAPTWDRVLENRSIAVYLDNTLSDLRGLVESRRAELEDMKAGIESGDPG